MNEWAKQNIGRYYLPIIIGVVALLLGVAIGYGLGIRNVHDHGGGNAGVGQQIEQAGTDIQHAADGIKEAAGTADQIGAGLTNAKESAGHIHSTAATSAELVAECQSIIARVRARGAQNTPSH